MSTEKERAYAREYYRKNREKLLESKRRWNKAHPEIMRDATRRWRERHADEIRERDRKRKLSYNREYYAKNRDEILAKAKRKRAIAAEVRGLLQKAKPTPSPKPKSKKRKKPTLKKIRRTPEERMSNLEKFAGGNERVLNAVKQLQRIRAEKRKRGGT